MCLFLGALTLVCPTAAAQGTHPGARPTFEGIWNSATVTPLERPPQVNGKAFFTPEEATEWERQVAERNQEPPPGATRVGTGTYNTFFREFGTQTVRTLRTSIVTDPPDGRIPALTPAAAEIRRRKLEGIRNLESAEDALVVHAEMIHDASIIRLDGSPHPPSSIRLWRGDSVGRAVDPTGQR